MATPARKQEEEPEPSLLPHEFEAMFAEIDRGRRGTMTRLRYLTAAIERVTEGEANRPGAAPLEVPEDSSVVVHLQRAAEAATKKSGSGT
jgi:hypothetical protein